MAQDFNNIPAGLNITTQIPLNIKENIINEVTLSYLGINDNLAYTYHDQLIVNCLEEGTRYIWREVKIGEENTGLCPLDFTYPSNIVAYGITYSNKKYNFFLLPNIEQTYSIDNIGDGVEIYKNSTILDNNTQFNFRSIESDSLDIQLSVDGNKISIEQMDSGIPMFIVNSNYTGDVELGTTVKPFKNLQNALDAYVGNGASNKAPENIGTIITIEEDSNTFVGSLAYAGLSLLIKNGATLTSDPSIGGMLCDIDSDAILPTNVNYSMIPFTNTEVVEIVITVEKGGNVQLLKEGFKNRGVTTNTGSAQGKTIRYNGDRSGLYKVAEVSVVSPSVKRIFSLNADNQVGFFNDGAYNVISSATIQTFNSQIAYVGLNARMSISDCLLQFGESSSPFNINTVPIKINGGTVMVSSVVIANPLNLVNLISLENGALFTGVNSLIGDSCDYIFANLDSGGTTSCILTLDKCNNNAGLTDAFIKNFMSSGIWNVRLTNCNINTWNVDEVKIKLIPNSINTLGLQSVETLETYTSKALAVIGGLFSGCSFIKATNVDADDLQSGVEYKITTVGTPALGTLNTYFTSTGTETGTGVGTLYSRENII
jgi:hypothetical protein